jgi:hypothetical protein
MAINNNSTTGANLPFASVAQAQSGVSANTVISPYTLKAVIDPIQQTIDAIEGINDLQAFTSEVNAIEASTGINTDGTLPNYANQNVIGNGDTHHTAIGKLDAKAAALQSEIDTTQSAAGLNPTGNYVANTLSTYLVDAVSLKDADNKLDVAVAGVRGDLNQEILNRTNADSALQTELNQTQAGAGLNVDGTYTAPVGSNYLGSTTTIKGALVTLDTQMVNRANDIAGLTVEINNVETAVGLETNGTKTDFGSTNVVTGNSSFKAAIEALDTYVGDMESGNGVIALQSEVDKIETAIGSMIDSDGDFVTPDPSRNYIDTATSISNAIELLDTQVKTNADDISGLDSRLETAEIDIDTLQGDVIALDGRLDTAESNITSLDGRLDIAESNITSLDGRLDTAESDITNIVSELGAIETAVGLEVDGTKTDFASDYVITANSSFKAAIEALDTYVSGLESGNGTIALQSELNDTQAGAGLNTDGSYTPPEGSEFLGSTTSLKSALAALDTNLATITNDFDAHHLHSNSYYVNDGVSDLQTVINEIGADQGNVIYMSAGSYGGDDVAITNSANLNIIGPERSQGSAICELVERGMSISGVTTTRITINNLQIEGDFTINGTEGRHYFKNVQFLGNVLITNGTTNFITFDQCDFAGSITIASTVSAQVYFSRCGLGGNLVTSQRTGGSAPLLTILTECYGLNNSQSQLTSNVALVGRTGYANNTVVNNASSSNYTYNLLTGAQTSFSGAYSELRGKPTIPSASTDLSDSANLLRTSNIGTTEGKLVVLDSNNKIPSSLVPSSFLTNVHTVADSTELANLENIHTLNEGDVAIQEDTGAIYIWNENSEWIQINTGVGAVTSVNGKSGTTITLYTDDISEDGSPTNLWHTADRARTAAVVNSTAGSETNQAPSVSAIKSYITTALSDYELKTDNEASDILTKIKTVDGPGSGLDADLFDGLNSDVFVQTTGAQSIAGIKTFTDAPVVPNQTALNSSTKAANTKYVDDAVKVVTDLQGSTGILIYKGSYDASTNTPVLTSAKKGYFYDISASGTLAGVSLATTDQIVFVSDVVGGVIASTDFIKVDNTETPLSAGSLPVVKIGGATQLQQGIYYVVDSNSSFSVAVPTKAMVSGKTGGVFYIRHRGTGTVTVTATGVAGGEFLWYPGDSLTPGATFGVKSIALTRAGEYKFVATQIDGAASSFVQWDVTVNNHKALRTTDDLTEGSTNKYFSNTLARAAFTAGTGISISTGTISSTITQYTDEMAQDAAGSALVAGSHSGISFTYGSTQDTANRIDATVQIDGSALAWPAVALSAPPTATTLAAGNYYYSSTNTQGSAFSVTLPTTGRSGDVVYIHNLGSNTINTAVLAYYFNGAYSGVGQTFSMTTNDLFVFTRLSTGNVWMISVQPSVNLRSTTNITEGTNLYWTQERTEDAVNTLLSAGTHTGISYSYTDNGSSAGSLSSTVSLSGFSIDALSDVDTSTTSPTNGQALVWNSVGSKWLPGTVSGGGSFDVDSGNRAISSNTSVNVTGAMAIYVATAALTATLPAPSSSYVGKQICIKSYTTGAVTIQSASGSQIIYDSASASASITHPANYAGFSTTLMCLEVGSGTYFWVAI